MRRWRLLFARLRLGRRGVAAVELAIALPVTLLMVGNLVEYGTILRRQAQLAAGVANAAAYAAQAGSAVSVDTLAAVTTASSWLQGATASATPPACHCPAGTPLSLGAAVACTAKCADGGVAQSYVIITGSYAYTPVFPLVIGTGPRTLTHSAKVVLR